MSISVNEQLSKIHVSRFTFYVLLSFFLSFGAQGALAAEFSGRTAVEGRIFPQEALSPTQHGRENLSIVLEPEFYHEWADGDMSLTIEPYFHLDQHDSERTHFDVREFFWQVVGDTWELQVGLNTVFWGVTESQHLVDIINQTDLVENLDGEDKLGQPMVNFTWIQSWGTVDFFILPFFRERTFPGEEGRLRFPLPVDTDHPVYESDAEERHVDLAARWSHTLGDFDVGVSHFYGTSREPGLAPHEEGLPLLTPHYDLIHQMGLDVQFTKGSWLWKLEAIGQDGRGKRFTALTGGFEYTFANVLDSGADIGIVGEYIFDDRGDDAPTPFEDDLFVGVRLALNDVQSTQALTGGIVDRETGATNFAIEASRRLGESWTLEVEARGFFGAKETDLLYGLRKEDYAQAQLVRHF